MTTVTIKTNAEAVIEQEKTYKAGDFFLVAGYDLCQLVQSEVDICFLASMNNGNRYKAPQKVGNSTKVTLVELCEMTSHSFVPVKSVKITYEI